MSSSSFTQSYFELFVLPVYTAQRYLMERKQFGASLAAFQITQQKLIQMLGNVQAMILTGWRICKMYDKDIMTAGHVSLAKV